MSDFQIVSHCAVVALSTSSLDMLAPHHPMLRLLPLYVHLNQATFIDGVELQSADFYEQLSLHSEAQVATSPPNEEDVIELFRELEAAGYQEVIVTTLSHTLSDTPDIIRHAVIKMNCNLRVYLVDTGSVCMPEGFFAQEAIRLLQEGMMPEDIVQYLEKLKTQVNIFFSVHSLKYLHQNGRLNRTEKIVADWLHLKPILRFHNGSLSRIGIACGAENTFDALIKQVLERTAHSQPLQIYGLYGGNAELYEQFAQRLQQKTGFTLTGFPISPVVGAHIGPDAIGVGIIERT